MLPRLLDSRLDLVLLAKLTLVATSGVVRDGDSVRDTALPLGNQILTFKPLDLSYKLCILERHRPTNCPTNLNRSPTHRRAFLKVF